MICMIKKISVYSFFLILCAACLSAGAEAGEGTVRKSPIAGSWYPGNKEKLREAISELLSRAELPDFKGRPFGIISPHAGMQFSGRAAACGFKALQRKNIKRVLLLGPSHNFYFSGVATSGVDAYETPLGTVSVDRTVSDELYRLPLFKGRRDAEMPEHSLEMQLPFLQAVLDDFTIVPLVVGAGDLSATDYQEIAAALQRYVDSSTVVVVSSDFTHYGGRFGYVPFRDNIKENLEKLDGGAIEKIIAKDFDGFQQYIQQSGATICGARPIGVFLKMLTPASQGTLLTYYTSGDLLHDYTDCVSYASIIFTVDEASSH